MYTLDALYIWYNYKPHLCNSKASSKHQMWNWRQPTNIYLYFPYIQKYIHIDITLSVVTFIYSSYIHRLNTNTDVGNLKTLSRQTYIRQWWHILRYQTSITDTNGIGRSYNESIGQPSSGVTRSKILAFFPTDGAARHSSFSCLIRRTPGEQILTNKPKPGLAGAVRWLVDIFRGRRLPQILGLVNRL